MIYISNYVINMMVPDNAKRIFRNRKCDFKKLTYFRGTVDSCWIGLQKSKKKPRLEKSKRGFYDIGFMAANSLE